MDGHGESGSTNSFERHCVETKKLIADVMGYEIRGARGKLVKHLLGFALDPDWWSVYSQQYNKSKMPFVVQEKPLRKLVYVYREILKMDDSNDIDGFIKSFEYSIVRDIGIYSTFTDSRAEFNDKWKSQHMSFKQLAAMPLKYHKVWTYFFLNRDNKSIPKLIDDIERILEFHERAKRINMKTKGERVPKPVTDEMLYQEITTSYKSDNDDDESDDDDDVVKRKAVVMDATPVENMMETLVENVKRQKVYENGVLSIDTGVEHQVVQSKT